MNLKDLHTRIQDASKVALTRLEHEAVYKLLDTIRETLNKEVKEVSETTKLRGKNLRITAHLEEGGDNWSIYLNNHRITYFKTEHQSTPYDLVIKHLESYFAKHS